MADILSNLLVHLKLDETSGTTAGNSGSGSDGTVITLDFSGDGVAGRFGRALKRVGNDERIELGALDLPDADQTLAAWVRKDGAATVGWIISAYDGTNGGLSMYLTNLNELIGYIKISANAKTAALSVSVGEWHHYAVVYDKAAPSMKTYFDGVLQVTDTTISGVWDPGGPYVVTNVMERPGSASSQDATYDEIRIYERALSAEDVRALISPYAVKGSSRLRLGLGLGF